MRTASGPGANTVRRPARYTLVSLGCGALAQVGLAVAYGVFGWNTTAASVFSLGISILPSYWGSRTYVWAELGRHNRRVELAAFVFIAILGTSTAIALTAATEMLGRSLASDRAVLMVWVNAGSVLATVVVWIARYFVLDRYLFAARR